MGWAFLVAGLLVTAVLALQVLGPGPPEPVPVPVREPDTAEDALNGGWYDLALAHVARAQRSIGAGDMRHVHEDLHRVEAELLSAAQTAGPREQEALRVVLRRLRAAKKTHHSRRDKWRSEFSTLGGAIQIVAESRAESSGPLPH